MLSFYQFIQINATCYPINQRGLKEKFRSKCKLLRAAGACERFKMVLSDDYRQTLVEQALANAKRKVFQS